MKKMRENQEVILTKLLISQLVIALELQSWSQSNAKTHYQLPSILIALQQIDLIKLSSIGSIHHYHVNVTLHFYE